MDWFTFEHKEIVPGYYLRAPAKVIQKNDLALFHANPCEGSGSWVRKGCKDDGEGL